MTTRRTTTRSARSRATRSARISSNNFGNFGGSGSSSIGADEAGVWRDSNLLGPASGARRRAGALQPNDSFGRASRQWVQVKRPPAPGIRFVIDTWVPLEKLTETERQKYFAEKTRRDEARKAEQGTTSDSVLNADHQLGKLPPDIMAIDEKGVFEPSWEKIPTFGSSSEATQIPATAAAGVVTFADTNGSSQYPTTEDTEASEPSAKRRRMQDSIENGFSYAHLITANDAGAVTGTASDSVQFPNSSGSADTTLQQTSQLPNADINSDDAKGHAELPATQSSSAMLATLSDLGSKWTQDNTTFQHDLERSSPQLEDDRPAKRLRLDESSETKPSHDSGQSDDKLVETEKSSAAETSLAVNKP